MVKSQNVSWRYLRTLCSRRSFSLSFKYACLCSAASNSWRPHGLGSSVHGIFQARILEWAAISPSRGSSRPRDRALDSCVSCIGSGFFTTAPPGDPFKYEISIIQNCLCCLWGNLSSFLRSPLKTFLETSIRDWGSAPLVCLLLPGWYHLTKNQTLLKMPQGQMPKPCNGRARIMRPILWGWKNQWLLNEVGSKSSS